MVDTVTTQILNDGPRNTTIKLTNVSDGTGEAAVTKVDVSTLSEAPSKVRIDKIVYDIQGMTVQLLWDATADVSIVTVGNGQGRAIYLPRPRATHSLCDA